MSGSVRWSCEMYTCSPSCPPATVHDTTSVSVRKGDDEITTAKRPTWSTLRTIMSHCILSYDTMLRYDSVYLTYSRKLIGSQLISLPHGIDKILKWETKNQLMSVIGPVQSHYHESSPITWIIAFLLPQSRSLSRQFHVGKSRIHTRNIYVN